MSGQTRLSGSFFAGYAIKWKIGEGGMATVYLADDPKHRRQVALKLLRGEFAASVLGERFLREIEIAAALTHPNILPLYDSGNEGGHLYFVMPYVEGGSLRQRLERERVLPVDEAVRLARAVADALAYAHERGVVHRDIKPENILLEQGHPVVVDFGVARALASEGKPSSTGAGTVVGTPAYMSPEQASGESTVDAKADQYALACVLYEMLAGHPPFVGGSTRAVLARQVMDPPPPLATVRPGVPREVRAALERALAKAPTDRFASVRDFAEALATPVAETDPGPSIAVLPFVNLGSDPEDEFFGEGMAEEIILALTKIEGLNVASRTSTFALKNKNFDVRTIGQILNVRAVLEGSVRRADNTLRVTAQLINTSDGYHLWSARFDRERKDVFAIHDDIASNIVRALRVVLADHERGAITKAPTAHLDAYDYYLRGRQFFHQRRRKSMMFARQMFTRAIELDPSFALAHAGIADASSFLAHHYQDEDTARNIALAEAASLQALTLEPDLAEAHAAQGEVLVLLDRFPEAEREFRKAIELDPSQFEARYCYARACYQRGDLPRALDLFDEASRVREDHESLYFAAQTLTALNQTTEAKAAYHRALPVIERHLALNPDDARAITMAAVCSSRLGNRERGLEWAEQATAVDPEDASVCYNVACLFALEGETDRALDRLECAFGTGFAHPDWVANDPDLASLRADPRFQALLETK